MKTLLLTLLFVVCMSLRCVGQNDPLYNQYQFNQLLINPAYAGAHDRLTASWITRLQWVGVDGAPVTNTASVHTSFKAARMGLGMMVLNDRLGINNNMEVNAMYSYRLDFRDTKLQFGLQGGLVNFNYDYSKLTLEYLNDPVLMQSQDHFMKPNFGTGVFYYGSNFYIGASVPRLLNVDVHDGLQNSVRYRRHGYLSAGYLWAVSEFIKLKPSVLLKEVDGAPFSYDLNFNALFHETLWLGLTLRNQSALGLNAQLELSDKLRFGYSFEYPFKPMNFGSYGTHELMLSIDLAPLTGQLTTRRYF